MKGTALLLLCAATLAQADQPQLTLSGKVCNCNPEEAKDVCSQNGSDDQLIAHENCNKFYKCFDGSAIAYDCPNNLLYNPLAEVCDWPENVDCGNRPIVGPDANVDCSQENSNNNEGEDNNGETDEGNNVGTCNCNPEEAPAICAADGSNDVLVAHQNCNQFYKCDHGVPVALNCPSGLLYNPYTEQCDWAHNVECGDRPIVEIEGGGNNNGGDEDCEDSGNGNESGGGSGGNGDNGGTCNCNPDEAPGICGADGSDGVLVAHENCNQFYKCDHGVPVAQFCYPGLLYNPFTERCDWPHEVDCGSRPIVEGGGGNGDNGGGDNGGGDNGSGDNGSNSNNCDPSQAPAICAASGSDGVLVAHENCNQFYKCAEGLPVALYCPAGLLYNSVAQVCDWPDNVECGDRVIPDNGGGDNEGGDNGGGDNGGGGNGDGGGTCNCNPEEAPGICGAAGSEGVLVAHENCNQFYKCSNGQPVALFCPEGLLYDPYIERCNWPAQVECGNRPIVECDGGNGGSDNGGGDNGGGDNGGGDNGGGGNGGGSGTCNCSPEEAPGICGSAGSDGTLIAHENCNQFYKCAHGQPVALFCPEGLLYDPYIERCNWPAQVECGNRPIVEGGGGNGDNGGGDNGGGDNGGGDNGGGDNGGGDNGGGDNGGGSGTCNCNPEEAPGICGSAGSDGTLIAHENCNQFYKCAHGQPVALFCPEGLLYDPYIERCNWPAQVECGNRPIVEGGGGNGDNGGGDNGGGDNGGGDNGGGDNGGGDNGGGDNGGGSGTCNCNPEEAPGICGSAGSDGTLIAHENCNQFYKCTHGQPVALFCPEGLVYDPYIERCNWPAQVECGNRPIVEGDGGNGDNGGGDNDGGGNGGGDNGGGDNGGGDNGGGDNGGGSGTCNCNPEEAPGICGSGGSDGTLIAHENCNQFYKCAHGQPVALFCPEGLLYDPYIERCNWPAQVECGNRPIVEGGGGNGDNGGGDNGGGDNGGGDNGGGDNGGGDNGGGDNGGGSGTCNCNPEEAPGICGSAGSDGTLIAHENCNQFYKCAHGQPVALFCPEGLLYDPYIERCNWPAQVECGNRPIVEGGGGNGDNGGGDNGGGDNGGGDNGGGDNGGGDNGGGDNGGGSGTCNCSPEEAPGICGSAGSDGTLIAHENCNQFYKCAHGQPVALFCPEGLLYDPYIERCNWPAQVECGNRPIVEGGGGNGDNGGGDNGGGDNGGGDNGGGDNGGGDNGGGDNGGGSGTCNCNPEEAPGICGSAGSDGTLVAHENCNQFYKCSNGQPVALFCPEGLLYDPYIERCNWPAQVECGNRPIVEGGGGNGDNGGGDNGGGDNGGGDNGGGDNGGGDNGGGDNGGGSGTCNCNPEEAPGICGSAGSDGTLVAHENCNQFYKCSNGQPVALFCPEGLLYDPYIERCNWPAQVECGNRPIVEGGGGNGDNGGGDNSGGDNGSGDNGSNSNNCDPSQAPAICSASGSDGVLVAHENCNQFYKCAEGLPVALYCPAGLLYNSVAQVCDWPDNVECGDRVIPENGGGDNGGGDNGGGDNGGGDNGGGGNGDGGGTCNCNPEEAPGICGAAGSEGVLVAHENCNQFYKCSNGQPVALFCPEGLLYDPYIERCNWPAQVECGNRPIVEGGGENGDNGGEDNGGDDNGGGNNVGGDNNNPSEAPAICANSGSNGVLIAHENCDQFYVCSYGKPVALNCPSNLLYNPVTEQCDWPRNVDCSGRVVPEPESDGGDNGPCSCNAREAPSICAGRNSNGKLIAHENCNQYYVCFEGAPVARYCPRSLFYEPHTEQCLWPASVSCEGRDITSISTYTSLNKHIQARRGFF